MKANKESLIKYWNILLKIIKKKTHGIFKIKQTV